MLHIRPMRAEDEALVTDMMRVFYASPAVLSNGSAEIFHRDIQACVSDSPYAQGFVFEQESAAAGYGMLALSYSTEFGRLCVWIEDLYVLPAFRGQGIGAAFIDFVRISHPEAVVRLEVERDNLRAQAFYRRCGLEELPYMEMIAQPGKSII